MTAKPEEHILRAWWLCEPAGECSSCIHTGLHLSVMPDHRAPMPKHADETVHPLSDWLASRCLYSCVSALRQILDHARGRLSCSAEGLNSHISVVCQCANMTFYSEELNLQYG